MADMTEQILRDLRGKKIAIIGDLVADQFLHGTIARVSREAPVFILRHDETDTRGGAAANAAVNCASLGGEPILVGVVGDDENGRTLRETLRAASVDDALVLSDDRIRTTTKIRVLAGGHYSARQQVIRIDYENSNTIAADIREHLAANVRTAAEAAGAVVISDYNYGVADPDIFSAAVEITRERGIPLIIDSRSRLGHFSGATSATPNQEEVEQMIGKGFSAAQCEELRERLGLRSLLVTRGNEGMLLLENGKEPLAIPAVGSLEPVDVTGAGDTVIAAYSLALASGASFSDAARLANHAGGIVVMKKGTAAVTAEELAGSIRRANVTADASAADV